MGFWRKSKAKEHIIDSVSTPWNQLNRDEQLDEIIAASFDKPQLIFKHSTRCGISGMVKDQFTAAYPFSSEEAGLYYLDLLNFRALSDEIASRFNVWHESPQLIILKGGQVVAHESHGSILGLKLADFI